MKKSAFTTHSVARFFNENGEFWTRQSICCVQGPNGVFLKKILVHEAEEDEVSVVKFVGPVEMLTEWVTRLGDFDNESANAFLDCIWSRKSRAEREPGEFWLAAGELPDLNVGSRA